MMTHRMQMLRKIRKIMNLMTKMRVLNLMILKMGRNLLERGLLAVLRKNDDLIKLFLFII